MARKVTIGGTEYPVAVTFAAIAAYLESVGENDADGMSNFSQLPPSRYPHLIAACVNEGLRKEGRDERLTPETVADCDFVEVGNAIAVVFMAMAPQTGDDDEKKKD